jgi:hypothetical protein
MQAVMQPFESLPRPSWPPTERDWSIYKPLITDLYISKDEKLEIIREFLETRYGFKARSTSNVLVFPSVILTLCSPRMYKARLTRWKLKKYSSARDKESAAKLLETYRQRGIEAYEISESKIDIPLHAIRRHCRQKGIFDEVCSTLPWSRPKRLAKAAQENHPKIAGNSGADAPYSQCQALVTTSHQHLSLETDLDVVQHILTLTSEYFEAHFGRDGSEEQLELARRPASIFSPNTSKVRTHASVFWSSIICGLDSLLASNPTRAWQAFHRGCSLVGSVLREQRRGLLKLIYLLFSDDRWQHFTDLRIAILKYFADMSAITLGKSHQLSVIIRLCKDPVVFYNSGQRIHEVLAAIFRDYARRTAARRGELLLNDREKIEYAIAKQEAQAIVSASETSLGPFMTETRKALQRLAQNHIDHGNYTDGQTIFLDVIRRGRIELGGDYLDEPSIFSHQNLACLSDMQGDLERAEAHWRLAFEGAVLQLGVDHYETQYCRHHLDSVQLRRGLLDHKICVHDFLVTCALQRRPSMSASPPALTFRTSSGK